MFCKRSALMLASGALLLMSALPASAVTIFSDNFNRAPSDTVGNGWEEYNAQANDVAIVNNSGTNCTGDNSPSGCNNQLRLRDQNGLNGTVDAGVAQIGSLSTTGYQDIMLGLDFKRLSSNSSGNDLFRIQWKLSSDSVWDPTNTIYEHGLGSDASSYVPVLLALGPTADNAAGIDIRIYVNLWPTSGTDEGAIVDNVVLSGNLIPPIGEVPLPGSLPLLLSGLAGASLIVRKRRRRLST